MTLEGTMTQPDVTSETPWGLRHPGLAMNKGGTNEVTEFTGMWPLKSDFDLESITGTLVPGGLPAPRGGSFSAKAATLGRIRSARWFVGTSAEFGLTLYFICQFDGPVETFFDDLLRLGAPTLGRIWGQCIGCPEGSQATARAILEYIARGQIKTLAVYDPFPGLSHGDIQKAADWYEKTRKFQRALMARGGTLEEKVSAFMNELARPCRTQPGDAAIDRDAGREWQYFPQRLDRYVAGKVA